jgi:hypothetical protein
VRRAAAAVDLANAILAHAMACAFVLWLIGEDWEGSSRVLGIVSDAIVALLLVGEDREHQWWTSGFVLVVLVVLGIAMAIALLGPVIPGPPP